DALLFSGSIAGNIKYGLEKADTQQIIDAAKKAGAHEFISRLKDGYETKINERGINFSTGQRQLICFARAIIKNPPILILDEATANVDTKTEEIIRKALIEDKTKRTCLIIAHRLSTAVFANRIIVMDQGRIIEIGSHEQLMENRGLYYKMQEMNILR
ncbi:MAG: ATP-binding cassette domain-containing protein, partial [Chloroflexi bacterium]|nr:ATP-binding cassette domain-containing protein [Chloroflexota bacterium]